jgi:hypothetical protein
MDAPHLLRSVSSFLSGAAMLAVMKNGLKEAKLLWLVRMV